MPCNSSSMYYCPVGGGCNEACLPCPLHTQPSAGATTCISGGCFVCPAGAYCDGGNTVLLCAAGTFSGAAGQSLGTVCAACGQGLYASAFGATVCAACGPGTAATVASGATGCLLCSAGTFSTAVSAYAAVVIIISNGNNASSGAICGSLCAKGTYASGVGGSAACAGCNGGTYAAADGASVCQVCPAGTGFVGNASSGARTEAEGCLRVACPANSVSGVAGATSVAACVCRAGFFSPTLLVAGGCAACLPGSYAATTNASACLACPVNTFDPSTLASTVRDTLYGVCGPVSGDCWAPSRATNFYANAGFYRDLVLTQCRPCPRGACVNGSPLLQPT